MVKRPKMENASPTRKLKLLFALLLIGIALVGSSCKPSPVDSPVPKAAGLLHHGWWITWSGFVKGSGCPEWLPDQPVAFSVATSRLLALSTSFRPMSCCLST